MVVDYKKRNAGETGKLCGAPLGPLLKTFGNLDGASGVTTFLEWQGTNHSLESKLYFSEPNCI